MMHKYNMAVGRDLKDGGQMRPKASTSRGDSFSGFDRSLGLTGAVLAVLVGCLLLGLLGCGLQYDPYFGPPIFSYETGVFELSDSGNFSASTSTFIFRGYEIFYRVYSSESTAISDQAYLSNFAASVTNESNALKPNDFVQDAKFNKGFTRIRRIADSIAPLIAASDQTSFLKIPQDAEWYVEQDGMQTTVCRNLSNTTSRLSFYKLSNYENGDDDYEYSESTSGSALYFVFFAVGYWTNTEDFSENYGAPAVIPQVVPYTPGV